MTNEEEFTTIRIRKTTCERLKKHGVLGDNMDVVMTKVLEKAEG